MNKMSELDNPSKIVRDPHHDGFSEWCYVNNKFYIRPQCQKKWTEVKRMRLTPARILALASLLGV